MGCAVPGTRAEPLAYEFSQALTRRPEQPFTHVEDRRKCDPAASWSPQCTNATPGWYRFPTVSWSSGPSSVVRIRQDSSHCFAASRFFPAARSAAADSIAASGDARPSPAGPWGPIPHGPAGVRPASG
jgi:hypothetical protein